MNYEYSTTHLTDNRALFNSTKFMAFSSAKDCRRNIELRLDVVSETYYS